MMGLFFNPSLTHFGCIEIFRLDAENRPSEIDFIGFDELSMMAFATPALVRAAKLFYEDGRAEVVAAPLLYGLTRVHGDEHDRTGRITRFVGHLEGDASLGEMGNAGIGIGHQDFYLRDRDGGGSLFGLGSVREIHFPLDMADPRFEVKARARGIDPDEVRRRIG